METLKNLIGLFFNKPIQKKVKTQTAKVNEVINNKGFLVVRKKTIRLEKFAVQKRGSNIIFPYRRNDSLITRDLFELNGIVRLMPIVSVLQRDIFISNLILPEPYIFVGYLNVDYLLYVKDLNKIKIVENVNKRF